MEENCYTKDILYSSHAKMHSKLRCDTRKIIPWCVLNNIFFHIHDTISVKLYAINFGANLGLSPTYMDNV